MKSEEIRQLLNRIEELKNLFTMQQQLSSFLEDLFSFLEEIIPLSRELSESLAESTSKMPFATRQLDNVTQATEMATTEILTLLEEMMSKIEHMTDALQQRDEKLSGYLKLEDSLTSLLKKVIGKNETDFWNQFRELQKQKKELLNDFKSENATFVEMLNLLNDQANNIMLALQVQDITAQQIASVNHVLVNIKARLENLLKHFGEHQVQNAEISFENNTTFDPDARFEFTGEKQKVADEVIETVLNTPSPEEEKRDEPVSASDIDALFNSVPSNNGDGTHDEKEEK